MASRLSPHVLEEMAAHVCYEVDRLAWWSRVGLPESSFAGPDAVRQQFTIDVGMATLESALIHLRNVAQFLVNAPPGRGKRDEQDIVASDYFDEAWESRPSFVIGPDLPAHKRAMGEIHRRLAHLSCQRLDVGQFGPFRWDSIIAYVPGTIIAFGGFVRDLAKMHPERAAWFDDVMVYVLVEEQMRDAPPPPV